MIREIPLEEDVGGGDVGTGELVSVNDATVCVAAVWLPIGADRVFGYEIALRLGAPWLWQLASAMPSSRDSTEIRIRFLGILSSISPKRNAHSKSRVGIEPALCFSPDIWRSLPFCQAVEIGSA